MPGKVEEVLRRHRGNTDDCLVQGNPDRHLEQHRHQAAGRRHAGLAVKAHLLLSELLLVPRVFFLQLGDFRLERLHRLARLELLHRQRVHRRADDEREHDYTQTEAVKKKMG